MVNRSPATNKQKQQLQHSIFALPLSLPSFQHPPPPQANGARDALTKALYIRTVVAIMRRINTLLRGASQRGQPPQDSSQVVHDNHIHVVDLFGFEANEVAM